MNLGDILAALFPCLFQHQMQLRSRLTIAIHLCSMIISGAQPSGAYGILSDCQLLIIYCAKRHDSTYKPGIFNQKMPLRESSRRQMLKKLVKWFKSAWFKPIFRVNWKCFCSSSSSSAIINTSTKTNQNLEIKVFTNSWRPDPHFPQPLYLRSYFLPLNGHQYEPFMSRLKRIRETRIIAKGRNIIESLA